MHQGWVAGLDQQHTDVVQDQGHLGYHVERTVTRPINRSGTNARAKVQTIAMIVRILCWVVGDAPLEWLDRN
eukprot:1941616-Prymnesium_polylepis.1